jgi:hypothetical protein
MAEKLFTEVLSGHDPKQRIVMVIKDKSGFSVYKPRTGYKGNAYAKDTDPLLEAEFAEQLNCTHNHPKPVVAIDKKAKTIAPKAPTVKTKKTVK